MPSLAVTKAANAATKLPFRPVALFVGGTSGIGQVRLSLCRIAFWPHMPHVRRPLLIAMTLSGCC